jgi:H+-transporting ATPase
MDTLCADKTGTLTRNALDVIEIVAMQGFDRDRVLQLAALASSDADQTKECLLRFVPFDPATKTAEALATDSQGRELHVIKGAFEVIAKKAEMPAEAPRQVDSLAAEGHRVIAVAVGPEHALRLAGLIALSDPPREDSAGLIAALRDMNVRTVMVTGDSPVTAAAIAGKVGIAGAVCPPERVSEVADTDAFGVFARVVPEEKFRLVKALQHRGHVVGMCGDGTNDAPALRQAQIGIAVSSATDVAKAAAGMVLTEPGACRHRLRGPRGPDRVPAAADLHLQHAGEEVRDRPVPGGRARADRPRRADAGADGAAVHDQRLPGHVAHH